MKRRYSVQATYCGNEMSSIEIAYPEVLTPPPVMEDLLVEDASDALPPAASGGLAATRNGRLERFPGTNHRTARGKTLPD